MKSAIKMKVGIEVERYASVWDAIADTPEEAANLRVRAELLHTIEEIVKDGGWTQTEAAVRGEGGFGGCLSDRVALCLMPITRNRDMGISRRIFCVFYGRWVKVAKTANSIKQRAMKILVVFL
jgi:hypothetical protein